MTPATVVYHHEDGTWWADSPDVPGFTAVSDTLSELRQMVREGVPFYLDESEVELYEQNVDGTPVRDVRLSGPSAWVSASAALAPSSTTSASRGGTAARMTRPMVHLELTA